MGGGVGCLGSVLERSSIIGFSILAGIPSDHGSSGRVFSGSPLPKRTSLDNRRSTGVGRDNGDSEGPWSLGGLLGISSLEPQRRLVNSLTCSLSSAISSCA